MNKNTIGLRRIHVTDTILSAYCAEHGTALMFKTSVAINTKPIQLYTYLCVVKDQMKYGTVIICCH